MGIQNQGEGYSYDMLLLPMPMQKLNQIRFA
jgi:hypothetical protein